MNIYSITQKKKMVFGKFWTICILAAIVLLPSHPLQQLLGITVKNAYIIFLPLLLFYLILIKRAHLPKSAIIATWAILLLALIGSLLSGTVHQLLIGLSTASIIIIAFTIQSFFSAELNIKYIIWINILILVGGWLGFFYAYAGGGPVYDLVNPENGQTIYLYLTTFTNSVTFNYIRPSGIFDEPGSLAMFTIIIVILNEIHYKEQKYSILLLSLNLVTFSIMALIAILAYLYLLYSNLRLKLNLSFVIFVLIIAFFGYRYSGDAFQLFYLDRVKYQNKGFSGDNRTRQIQEFFSLVDKDILIAGSVAYRDRYKEVDQSSNPFSLLYSSGLLIWLPYLFLILWLLSLSFIKSSTLKFTAVILALLLLQRPYIYSLYWGFLLWISIASIFFESKLNTNASSKLAKAKIRP